MEVNGQRFVRTGDNLLLIKDNKKRKVHYIVNTQGEMSFEEPISKIKTIIVYNGSEIQKLQPKDFNFK